MTTLQPITEDPAHYAVTRLCVSRARFPEGMEVHESLGKGSNNKVYRATVGEQDLALRAPRRRSDTQQRGSAMWEFRHTLKAAQLGVGPQVYDAWCAKHAKDGWPSGLYVVTERLDHDMDTVLCDEPELRQKAVEHADAIGAALLRCVHTLAKERIFVFDLKPSNIMVRFPEAGTSTTHSKKKQKQAPSVPEVRIIDFGRDFCEWAGCEHEPDARTPIVDMVRKLILRDELAKTPEEAEDLLTHVLFASMMVLFAATTTYRLYEGRDEHRMGAAERRECNMVAPIAKTLLESMQGRHVALVRHVLRVDEVRGVLRHYLGRRNSGTRRTLRFAKGL